MSNRTLIEINHDFAYMLKGEPAAFGEAMLRYLNSASRETAESMERYGVRVIGMRHHSGNFILDGEPDGFPVTHLAKPKPQTVAVQVGQDVLVFPDAQEPSAIVLVGRSLSEGLGDTTV